MSHPKSHLKRCAGLSSAAAGWDTIRVVTLLASLQNDRLSPRLLKRSGAKGLKEAGRPGDFLVHESSGSDAP